MACLPNDPDELRRIALMGKTMDRVFDAISRLNHNPNRCDSCGRDKKMEGLCSLCSDGQREMSDRSHR